MEAKEMQKSVPKLGILGAIISAIAASLCCIGPFVLMILGVSGAWIGSLTALEPYRPFFIAFTLAFLGLAFYKVYRKPAEEECEPGSACKKRRFLRPTKTILWIVTIIVLILLSTPYIITHVYAANNSEQIAKTKTITLKVDNMTCRMCTITVRKSLAKLAGVKEAKVTLKPPRAVVTFDTSQVSVGELIKATTKSGYPSSLLSRKEAKKSSAKPDSTSTKEK